MYDSILTFKNILLETHSTCFYGVPAEDINFTFHLFFCTNIICCYVFVVNLFCTLLEVV